MFSDAPFPAIQALLDAAPAAPATTSEVYIVGGSDDVNVKIRGGQLDVKRRLRVDRGLELWSPVLKAAFPVAAAAVSAVFGYWGAPQPPLSRGRYTVDQFLDELVLPILRLRIVRVEKSRRQATHGGCVVEVATLVIEGHVLRTAAIESPSPELVRELARDLGLADHPTASYVATLRRLPHAPVLRAPMEGATP